MQKVEDNGCLQGYLQETISEVGLKNGCLRIHIDAIVSKAKLRINL